jgi:hypothetical protein
MIKDVGLLPDGKTYRIIVGTRTIDIDRAVDQIQYVFEKTGSWHIAVASIKHPYGFSIRKALAPAI